MDSVGSFYLNAVRFVSHFEICRGDMASVSARSKLEEPYLLRISVWVCQSCSVEEGTLEFNLKMNFQHIDFN